MRPSRTTARSSSGRHLLPIVATVRRTAWTTESGLTPGIRRSRSSGAERALDSEGPPPPLRGFLASFLAARRRAAPPATCLVFFALHSSARGAFRLGLLVGGLVYNESRPRLERRQFQADRRKRGLAAGHRAHVGHRSPRHDHRCRACLPV